MLWEKNEKLYQNLFASFFKFHRNAKKLKLSATPKAYKNVPGNISINGNKI